MSPSPEREQASVREQLRGGSRYGLVLLLALASLIFQLNAAASDFVRFVTIVLQAATLVAVVWTTGAHRTLVRWAGLTAMFVAFLSLVGWVVAGELPKAAAAIVSGLLIGVAPAVLVDRPRARPAEDAGGLGADARRRARDLPARRHDVRLRLHGDRRGGRGRGGRERPDEATTSDALYFSFVTLCTVGYGDILPVSDVARTFAVVEMLIGQIYLVTIVSLIVANLRPRRA